MATSKATGKVAAKAGAGKNTTKPTAAKGVASAKGGKSTTISYKMATVAAPSLRGKVWTGDWGEAPVNELTDKERLQFEHLEQFLPDPIQEGAHSLLIRTDGHGSCRTIYGPKLVNLNGESALQFGSALYQVVQTDTFVYLGELKGTLQVAPQEKPDDPIRATCVFRGKDVNGQTYSFELGVKLAEGATTEDLQGFTIGGEPLVDMLGAPGGGGVRKMKELVIDADGNIIDFPPGGYTWNITGFGNNAEGKTCIIHLEDEGGVFATGNSEAQLADGPIELPCHLVITSCVPAGQGHSVGNRIAPGYAPGTDEPDDDDDLDDEVEDIEDELDAEDDLDAEPEKEKWHEQAEVH